MAWLVGPTTRFRHQTNQMSFSCHRHHIDAIASWSDYSLRDIWTHSIGVKLFIIVSKTHLNEVFHLWGSRFLFLAQPSPRLIGPSDSSSEKTQSVGKKYQWRLTNILVDGANGDDYFVLFFLFYNCQSIFVNLDKVKGRFHQTWVHHSVVNSLLQIVS